MVKENRVLYDIQDLEGLTCYCTACKQEVLYRLNGPAKLPSKCPLCHADWYDDMQREVPEVVLLNTFRYIYNRKEPPAVVLKVTARGEES